MKKLISILAAALTLTVSSTFAQGVKGDVNSEKVINATKKMGKKNSPAAITTILYSRYVPDGLTWKEFFNKELKEEATGQKQDQKEQMDSFIDETLDKIAPLLRSKLEENATFTLIPEPDVCTALNTALEKQMKSKKAKNIWGVLSGKKGLGNGIWDGITMGEASTVSEAPTKVSVKLKYSSTWNLTVPGNYMFIPSLENDFFGPVQKATKCKSFIVAAVQVGVLNPKDCIKLVAKTSLYLVNAKGDVIKKIHAAAFSDPVFAETVSEDPSFVPNTLSKLTENSIDLATANFARESRLFAFKDGMVKKDTTELVTDSNVFVCVDTDRFYNVKDE